MNRVRTPWQRSSLPRRPAIHGSRLRSHEANGNGAHKKGLGAVIDILIAIEQPDVELRLPAERNSLPVVRQALRSLGESVEADVDHLEDAELAITEACANVVEHAYGGGDGTVGVSLRPEPHQILATVSDRGRGMPYASESRGDRRGLGLSMIEGIASEFDIRPGADRGTELAMTFDMGERQLCLNGYKRADAAPVERIARRIVAVIAAQVDMPSDRLVESLLAVELAARHSRRYLVGKRIRMSLERLAQGFELRLGPLVPDGAAALVRESELPVVGPVIERLADRIGVEPEPEGERLMLRIASD